MIRLPLKWKIALLSMLALFAVVALFTGSVYVAVSQWMMAREKTSALREAEQIASDFASHAQEGSGQPSGTPAWLRHYGIVDQTVQIYVGGRLQISYSPPGSSFTLPPSLVPSGPLQQGTVIGSEDQSAFVRAVVPISSDKGQTASWIVVYASLGTDLQVIAALVHALLVFGLLAVLFAGIVGYFVARAAMRPVARLTRSVRTIDAENLFDRLPVPKTADEIAELAETFNGMLMRVQDSMEKQTQFVADASHELRSPLAVIEGYANLLDRWGKSDPAITDKALRTIKQETGRLRHLTNDLLELASFPVVSGDVAPIDLVEPAREAAENFGVAYGRPIGAHAPDHAVMLSIRPDHVRQLLAILLHNAVKHTEPDKRVEVLLRQTSNTVELVVRDEGEGIPAESLPHLLERFYRVDRARSRKAGGSGLGLAIARELVRLYGGTIAVDSVLQVGTVVTTVFPRHNLAVPARGRG